MGRYVKNLRAFKGNAKFLSGSHEFKGSLKVSHGGESVALFRSGGTNIESFAYFKSTAVGIGTSAPTASLHIKRTDDAASHITLEQTELTGKSYHILSDDYGAFVLKDDSSTKFYLKHDGNIGIGTSTPVEALEVNGGIKVGTSSGTNLGTIRWESGDLEVYKTGGWTSLTSGGGSSSKHIRNRNAIVTHYTVTSNDSIIGVNATGSLTITLPDPSTLAVGQCFLIKDEAGNAGTHNITINARAGTADTIDGSTSLTMAMDDSAVNLYTDGSSKYFIY